MAAAIRSYVPRTSSLPPSSTSSSPNLPKRPAFVPRQSTPTLGREQSGSDEIKRNADAILKLLSTLPAPVNRGLGTKLLPAPRPSTPSPATPTFGSFKAYARAQKRKASDDSPSNGGLGLGINLSPSSSISSSRPPVKKARTNTDQESQSMNGHDLSRAPSTGTPPPRSGPGLSPRARSSLRNEITTTTGTADWTRDQWRELYGDLGQRSHLLKRWGDAFLNPSRAKISKRVQEDQLRGALMLTDSFCLYLYRNFAEERMHAGLVKTVSFTQLDPLRDYILTRWAALRTDDVHRERVKGMQGLIYLIEAVTQHHISSAELRQLSRRGKELSATAGSVSSAGGGAPAAPGSSASNHGPSPASTASPGTNGRSPASSAHSDLPSDMLKLLNATSHASSAASRALLTSRHHLSLRTLRESFPNTWDRAINSDLADDLLPAPGDSLGAARSLDINDPDTFAWPIELGMQNAIAHVAVYGRALVREFARAAGRPWAPVFNEDDE